MKSFKEYLTESKKVYEFKIKIAGDCPKDCAATIKEALSQFKVESCSGGKTTPITEKQVDFPQLENVGVTIFDVCLSYPTNTVQVREALANKLKIVPAKIRVRNMQEEAELEINHEHDGKSGKAMLGTAYENSDNSELVGEKHAMNFLKELNKDKHQGTQISGYNDEILAAGTPKHSKETPGKQVKVKNNAVNIFTKQIKVPTAKGVK